MSLFVSHDRDRLSFLSVQVFQSSLQPGRELLERQEIFKIILVTHNKALFGSSKIWLQKWKYTLQPCRVAKNKESMQNMPSTRQKMAPSIRQTMEWAFMTFPLNKQVFLC